MARASEGARPGRWRSNRATLGRRRAADPGVHRGRRDIVRLADAAERRLGLDLLAEVALLTPVATAQIVSVRFGPLVPPTAPAQSHTFQEQQSTRYA